MQKKSVIKFFVKLGLFLLPFLLLVLSFVVIDPFMVVRKHPDFNKAFTGLNPDYISTEVYLNNRSGQHYNAFIFGSSRVLAYKTDDWKTYLPSDASPFVYQADYESLFGIWSKVKYIDSKNDRIKYSLLVLDEQILEQAANNYEHLAVKDPRTTGESWLSFYKIYFSAYLQDFFFVKAIDYSLTKEIKPYMHGVITITDSYYNPVTNDLYPIGKLKSRASDTAAFYTDFRKRFPPLSLKAHHKENSVLRPKHIKMLQEIAAVLKKDETDYKIIISPVYGNYVLHPDDMKLLKEIFDPNRIYDFSGVNKYTSDIHSYYETFHYTIETGSCIMEDIYRGNYKSQ